MLSLELGRRSAKTFLEEACAYPENASLFSDEVLRTVIEGQSVPKIAECVRVAKAELAVRAFLSPSRYKKTGEMELLWEGFGRNTLVEFISQCERCGLCVRPQTMVDKALQSLSDPGCRLSDADASAVRYAFRPWLEADGVLPVFDGSCAYILPFSFVGEHVECPQVIDRSGAPLPEWTKWLHEIKDVDLDCNVQVNVHANEYVKDSGDSMMLPVVMAWLRKHDKLPRYDPLRFIATGSLCGGMLREVSVEEKAAKIDRDVEGGVLVRPGNGREDWTIPTGLRIDRVTEFLKEMAEGRYECSPNYAHQRLVSLDSTVRGKHVGEWEPLIDRLDRIWTAFDKDVDDEDYLHGLMLRSTARCHAGDTKVAEELNRQAAEIASKRPDFKAQQLRLEVEELVLLQDNEDFGKIFAMAPNLGVQMDDFAKEEHDSNRAVDLMMRYHGTIGQFEAYAALSGFNGVMATSSKQHFEKAFDGAVELARRSRGRIGGDEEADLATYNLGQDANYLLLWEALFGSFDGLVKASDRAREYVKKSRDSGCLEYADKNDAFRLRYEALGLYMSVLRGNVPGRLSDEGDIERLASSKGSWLPATTGKYLGAVAAARGDAVAAKQLFEAAIEKLASAKSPLFRCFRMTILAEAYRSLRKFSTEESYAEIMRKKALDAFVSDPDSAGWNKMQWKSWLESAGDDAEFPGLTYWY